mgnify:CR=1 FL=1
MRTILLCLYTCVCPHAQKIILVLCLVTLVLSASALYLAVRALDNVELLAELLSY